MTDHKNLAAALAAFQLELPTVAKGNEANIKSDKGSFKYSYADLADISPIVLPLLAKQGLAWSTMPTLTEHGFVLRYKLAHEAGESIEGEYPLPGVNTPAQQLGSAITYARRYILCAVTGVAPGGDDDDAGSAPPKPTPPAEWRKLITDATTLAELTAIYQNANGEGWATSEVMKVLSARKKALTVDPADPSYIAGENE